MASRATGSEIPSAGSDPVTPGDTSVVNALARTHHLAGTAPACGNSWTPTRRPPAFAGNRTLDVLATNDLTRALRSPFARLHTLARMTFLAPVARTSTPSPHAARTSPACGTPTPRTARRPPGNTSTTRTDPEVPVDARDAPGLQLVV
ncbi:MAG TPA: hypothetical protein VIU15_19860 [Streptomyces sp.]